MTPDSVAQLFREALITAFWLAAPLLISAFVIGIVISLLQIVTSIQDSAFSAIPRLIIVAIAGLVALPWMLKVLSTYTTAILGNLARYAR